MASKLVLSSAPTFSASVAIPVPGKKPVNVEFKFKGRTKAAFKEFMEMLADGNEHDDADVIMDVACGWELEEPFERENVDKLAQNYIGSARAIIDTYIQEITAARSKN